MSQIAAQSVGLQNAATSIETGFSSSEWRQLRLVWLVVAVAAGLIAVNPKLAGVWYAAVCLWIAITRPGAGLALILGGIPFTHNVSPGVVNLSISEVALVFIGGRALISGRAKLIPVILPIAAYLIVCLLSSAVEFRGRSAIVSFVQMGVYLVLALATFSAYGSTIRPVILALVAMVGTSTVLALIMVFQGGGGFLFGIHKNSIGATTATSTVIAVEMYFRCKAARDRVWSRRWLAMIIALSIGLFLTLSRGAWASTVIAVLVLSIARREWKVLIQLGIVILPMLVVGFFLLSDRFQEYILGSADTSTHSYGTRSANAEIAMSYFEQNRLIGSGLGLRKENDATNIVLFTLAETGILGLATFLSIHIVAIYVAFKKRLRVDLRSPGFTIIILSAALLLGRFGHGLVDHYWSRGAITATWALVGAMLAVPTLARSKPNASGGAA